MGSSGDGIRPEWVPNPKGTASVQPQLGAVLQKHKLGS